LCWESWHAFYSEEGLNRPEILTGIELRGLQATTVGLDLVKLEETSRLGMDREFLKKASKWFSGVPWLWF